MIKANDARIELLKNPSFERKVELYNEVSEIINKMIADGKDHFHVSEEQHYALEKEILDKGYKASPWSTWFFNNKYVYTI